MSNRPVHAEGAASLTRTPLESSVNVPELFAPVLTKLRVDAAACFGMGTIHFIPVGYVERVGSHVLRVAVHADPPEACVTHLFVKISKDRPVNGRPDGMKRRVAEDYEITRQVYEFMARSPHVGAVRPIACYPDQLAMITEEVRGPELREYLNEHAAWFPSSATIQRLESTMEDIGRWVRAFQLSDGAGSEDEFLTVDEIREYIDIRLQRLVAHAGSGFTAVDRERVLGHIGALGAGIERDDLRRGRIHGDLAPGNVIIGENGVVVLDFTMANRGSVYHDISRLFMQVGLFTAKPRFRPALIARLQLALLRGFEPGLSADRPIVRLLILMHRINHLATLSLGHESLLASLYNWRVRRQHRQGLDIELHRPVAPAHTGSRDVEIAGVQ